MHVEVVLLQDRDAFTGSDAKLLPKHSGEITGGSEHAGGTPDRVICIASSQRRHPPADGAIAGEEWPVPIASRRPVGKSLQRDRREREWQTLMQTQAQAQEHDIHETDGG